jgi:hypothetical protein
MLGGPNPDLDLRIIQLNDRPLGRSHHNRAESFGDPDNIGCRAAVATGFSAEMTVLRVQPTIRSDQPAAKERIGPQTDIAPVSAEVGYHRVEWLDLSQHFIVGGRPSVMDQAITMAAFAQKRQSL